jgi:hypothetical protein
MTGRQIETWSRTATALLARVDGDEDQRKRRVASIMGKFPSRLEAIVDGHGGVKPDTVFEFGEAVAKAGVPWSSGLLTLALTEPYATHALGVIGRLVRAPDIAVLRATWPAIMLAARVDHAQTHRQIDAPAILRMSTTEPTEYDLSKPAHDALLATWRTWHGHEADPDMPDILAAYMALVRVHAKQETSNRHLTTAMTATREAVLEMLDEFDQRHAIRYYPLPFPAEHEEDEEHD